MARCNDCNATFEGNRQPLCPFCGAPRPRPRVRIPPPPDPEAIAHALVIDLSTSSRRMKRHGKEVFPPAQQPRHELQASDGIDVEYAFNGTSGTITPITKLQSLPPKGAQPSRPAVAEPHGLGKLNRALGRLRRH